MMQNMFMSRLVQSPPITCSPTPEPQADQEPRARQFTSFAEQVRFHSDLSSDGEYSDGELISDDKLPPELELNLDADERVPIKRRKLHVPYRDQRKRKQEATAKEQVKALTDLEKLMKSKKTEFVGGIWGLQACRTCAIESHLRLVVKNGRLFMDASEMVAESNGFALRWGGRQVCSWTRAWIRTRNLPVSMQGKHAKVYSLLSDPTVAAEL